MNVAQLLEQSKTVSLILPRRTQESDTQEALLLTCALKKLGKQVSCERDSASLADSPVQEKTFLVSLKGLAPWVARVRYEKDATDLKLYFTLNQKEVSPEAFSLQIQNQADLTIIVGDKLPQNNAYQPSPLTLSANEAKKPLFNLLCAKEDPYTRLLGMVLSKLEYISRLHTHIILLKEEDFQSAHSEPKNLPLLVSELKASFGEQSSYLFLFDSSFGAQGILWSSSLQVRAKFRDIAGGQQKGPWVLLRPAPLASEQLKHAFLS